MNNNLIILEGSMVLTKYLAPYIAGILYREIGDIWWKQAIDTVFEHDKQLMIKIAQQERINTLDFRRCKLLIDSYWQRFFRLHLEPRFKTNLEIAYRIYNKAKHAYNQSDMPEAEAFQAISTMCLMMEDIKNNDAAKEIHNLLKNIGDTRQDTIPVEKTKVKKAADFTAAVIDLVNSVKAGEIASYGDLSQMVAGKKNKNYSQTIATVIKNNAEYIPSCHRIVGAGGIIKTQGKYNNTNFSQAELLKKEGISITLRNGREYVDLKRRKWKDLSI